jgi:peroxiredoxin
MIPNSAIAVVVFSLAAAPAFAGKFNAVLSPGDKAPTFEKLEATDGKTYSLLDFKKDAIVVVVTCNHCPVAAAYEDRIIEFTKKYSDSVDVVAINVSNLAADRMDKMKERAKEKGFNFTYLYDPSQQIGHELGAIMTPEFFVLNKERKVVYLGAMDDNNDPKAVKNKFLEEAVEAALKGSDVKVAETRARGCGVQYEKKSR